MSRLPIQKAPRQLTRRAALKLLAGSAAGVVLPSVAAFAAQSTHGRDGPLITASLTVEIITGRSTPEDTVLLSSTAGYPLLIQRFMPGLLVFGDDMLDLNRVLDSGELTIEPDAVQSVLLPPVQRRPDLARREYLQADAAVQTLATPEGQGAQILTLHALVDIQGTAIVYIPRSEDAVDLA